MVSDYLAQFYPQATSLTRVRLGSIPPAELHPRLEEHEVRMLALDSCKAGLAVERGYYRVALLAQKIAQSLLESRFVLDEKYFLHK